MIVYLFAVRGNSRTVSVFADAWQDYQIVSTSIKKNPGKDQNKVVEAMKRHRGRGLKWDYFPNNMTVLLDKVFKFQNKTFELGGLAAEKVFRPRGVGEGVVAVHTTCYEQAAKVMGLKVQ